MTKMPKFDQTGRWPIDDNIMTPREGRIQTKIAARLFGADEQIRVWLGAQPIVRLFEHVSTDEQKRYLEEAEVRIKCIRLPATGQRD